jgi:hypothetical protein
VFTLGDDGPALPTAGYVLLRSSHHTLDADAAQRLTAAAAASGADIVTFPVRDPRGGFRPPLGGAPSLTAAAHVLSAGSALVRGALVDGTPGDERGLELALARLVLTGARILVFPEPVASAPEVWDPSPAGWLPSWWPTSAGLADAHAVAQAFAPGRRAELADLPGIAAGLAGEATRLRQELVRATQRVHELSATFAEAKEILADRQKALQQRDLELAEAVALLRRAEADLDSERHRLATLRHRRAVKAALRVADAGARLRR